MTVGAEPAEAVSPDFWVRVATRAEAVGVDLLLLADSWVPGPGPRPDAVAVACRVAPSTRRIGLVPTVTTTHTEPFHTNKAIATLDLVSAGRAGWQVAVSTGPVEAAAFGRRPPAPPGRLWGEAADTVTVVRKLWDSWEDDAVVRDVATGRYVDRDRLHHVDHVGPEFSVKGPSITPRSPQGQPPVVVSLAADDPTDPAPLDAVLPVAAEHADLVRVPAGEGAPALAARVRAAAADRGRPAPLLLLDVGDLGDGPGAAVTGAAADGWDGIVLVAGPAGPDDLLDRLAATGARPAGTAGPRTLRERLGLPRPVSRYATDPTPSVEGEDR